MERAAVRYFLDFDMSRPLDISIQDRLARGLVEAPRAIVSVPIGFGGTIREKEANEISEVYSDIGGRPSMAFGNDRSESVPVKPKSDYGGKKQAMWETSSLASSQWRSGSTNGTNVGKGRLFHGKVKSDLTIDRINALQFNQQNDNNNTNKTKNKNKKDNNTEENNVIENQYNITNMDDDEEYRQHSIRSTSNRITHIDDDDDDFDRSSQQSKESSNEEENELDEDSLMRIGMESESGGKSKATTDQWIARELSDHKPCIIS
eukprot:TRINITY_DN26181_c0_g2_i1.p1 TRINITY_DN26181_c0_g2~~TRINITY_DN26181_c0_g2_i1.p1  ORF type:complete len:279 (-),score=4.18 TRINITY_DN26181_c0_g2_i1:40-825(-)